MEENKINEKGENICYCSKLNKYFLFPFFIPILSIFSNRIIKYLNKKSKVENINYFYSLYISTSLIVGGFSYFISLIKSRKKANETYIQSKNAIKLIYQPQNYNTKTVFIILLFVSLLFAINIFFGNVYAYNYNIIDERFYDILFISYLSKIILKTEIYRHQKFSIVLSFIGFIFLFIPTAIKLKRRDILINFIWIITSLFYSVFLVLTKYVTCKYFASQYSCCLITGIFSTIFILAMIIIHFYGKNGDISGFLNSFKITINIKKFKFYSLLILSYLFYSTTQYRAYMTIYFFSPMVFIMAQIIFPLLKYAVNIIVGEEESKIFDLIFNIIGYLILLFAVLVYHENIILNFWKLNKNTKKFIEKRQKEDILLLEMGDNNINDKRNESEVEINSEYYINFNN